MGKKQNTQGLWGRGVTSRKELGDQADVAERGETPDWV